jgi:translocator protein
MKNKWVLPNITALIIVLAVNALATILPINGQTTAEVSDSFPVLFTPAGYVFSIWGLIYLLLIAFTLYQALPQQRTNRLIVSLGCLFSLSCLLNSAWIFAWHYNQMALSVLIMLLLLMTLATIHIRIMKNQPLDKQDQWLVKLPFSVYLAWICVATIANISIALYSINWSGWGLGPIPWTIIMLSVGALLAGYVVLTQKNIAFALVFVWAFFGIYIKQQDVSQVPQAALLFALLIAAAALASLFNRHKTASAH